MAEKRTCLSSNFGVAVHGLLAEAKTTQAAVATATTLSQPYLNQMITGRKKPAPQWVDLIADVLKLPDDKRRELHLAAARDMGFKL